MNISIGKKLFVYTGLMLVAVLLLAFVALERDQSRQWEEFLQGQSLSFARFATPEILKQFRGTFSRSDEPNLNYVYDFLGFNRDLIRFDIYSPSGRQLFESPHFPDYIDTVLPADLSRGLETRLQTPRVSVQTRKIADQRRVLDLLVPAFGPTGEQILSVRYLVSFDSVDRRLAEMRSRFLRIGAVALLVATLLAAAVARSVVKPLTALTEGARAIGDGEFSTRLKISTRDEIGALARAFNEMAGNLAASQAALTEKNSALQAANVELQQVQAQLIRSERLAAIGQLAAGVSHEIDNPIGIILGYAELLSEEMADDDARRADLQAIIDECYRCRRITGGLLGFARAHSSERELVDLAQLLRATVESLRPQKLFREVAFDLDGIDPGVNFRLVADSDRLRQVLVNLLLNAAQAMQGRGRIALRLWKDGEVAVLTVADSGPGIDATLREQIFEPFYSTKASGEGTGLGLSLCRSLVEDHNGQLTLDPQPETGACFRLVLPLVAEKTL